MGKIQKALGKLRSIAEVNRGQPESNVVIDRHDSTAPTKQSGDESGVAYRSKVRVRTRYLPDVGAADEKLPDFEIKIALDVLRDHGLIPRDEDIDLIAQQFRRIKRPVLNIAFGIGVPDSDNANVIMLASALPQSGKTFCSINLATSIAIERDVGAVLVDADVLKPNISRVLDLQNHIGLIDYLLDSSVKIDDILVGTDLHGIVVIPAGRQHEEATELLASRRMKQFVESLSERFSARAIIVDTPPLLLTNEANVLADLVGQIVMVIEAGESSQASVIQALSSLNKAKPINAILNKARSVSLSGYGGSGYSYYLAP